MSQIATGILVTVISAFIVSWLGVGNGSKTTIKILNDRRPTKIWKIFIVMGWLMFIGGGSYTLSWGLTEGLDSPKTGIGLLIFIVGIFVLAIGKFGAWWNQN